MAYFRHKSTEMITDFDTKKCVFANLARIVKLFNFLSKGKAYHPTY